ncbi:MAG TPA: hypothetical protein VK071_13740 [Tissierellales bacterium]|nr:hypothetical protein [Tissierellales bacterium]
MTENKPGGLLNGLLGGMGGDDSLLLIILIIFLFSGSMFDKRY